MSRLMYLVSWMRWLGPNPFGDLLSLSELDLGYRLVVTEEA